MRGEGAAMCCVIIGCVNGSTGGFVCTIHTHRLMLWSRIYFWRGLDDVSLALMSQVRDSSERPTWGIHSAPPPANSNWAQELPVDTP